MKCPNCQETLLLSERRGIEIDYCPNCRGVWLDRGELDKLLQQENEPSRTMPQQQIAYQQPRPYNYNDEHYKHHYKKKSILGELFDF